MNIDKKLSKYDLDDIQHFVITPCSVFCDAVTTHLNPRMFSDSFEPMATHEKMIM